MKRILTICLLTLTLVFTFQYLAKPVEALQPRCPKNSFFPCREEVLQMINKAIVPLQTLINSLTGKTDNLEKKVADLEARVKGLEQNAHCPNGMIPEVRFEGDTSPLKCKPVNPQPTPQPSLQVNCGSTQNGNELQINITADKPLKSCGYTTYTGSGSEDEPSASEPIVIVQPIAVTPNGNSCSFTENNCGRNINVTVESFDNELEQCNYPAGVPEPGTNCN